ncbi:chlorophyll synthase ChlG [Luminiphilus sp. nBUS_16]|uniref:chlorophyll synthase ChlG n=1 Tax=unclassified Luminiphilus TaxID=2633198 RepID=UPI003EB89A58
MQRAPSFEVRTHRPQASALLELLKPITWFPPMWAFLCGAVSSGSGLLENPVLLIAGILLAGPMVCGASQIVNDWFDREVDAINEPQRAIPSGRVPGNWGLIFAVVWTALAGAWGAALGFWVGIATLVGLTLAWMYSAPPFRLKRNGWWGAAAVGLSYEGLAWLTGAAVFLGGMLPAWQVLAVAGLYSLGAHGIMTLNDFKSVAGDRALGLRSLPAVYGLRKAAIIACWFMAVPQFFVVALLVNEAAHWQAAVVALLIAGQLIAMSKLVKNPEELAPWYNGTGVMAYVSGMMVTATALSGLAS